LSLFRNQKLYSFYFTFSGFLPIIPAMMVTGRPPKDSNYVERKRVTYRLRPEMVQAIKRAARRRKISQTAYVELAVEELLKK
jgi:hypothetical protein